MKLSFQLDPSCSGRIRAGDTLSGELQIKTSTEVRSSGISLYFRGKEYTRIEHEKTFRDDDGKLTTATTWERERHQFFRVDLIAHNEANVVRCGQILPGYYAVPFSFVVPLTLPGSVCLKNGDETASASVLYYLRAQLQDSGVFWNYQARKEVEVIAAPQLLRSVPFKSRCRELGLFVNCSNTHVAADQQPKIKISISDGKAVKVKSVKMYLLQSTSLAAEHYRASMRHVLSKRNLTGKRGMLFPDKEIKGLNRLGVGHFDLQQSIPRFVSYDGRNIRVSHSVEVEIVAALGSRLRAYKFSIPITVAPARSRLASSPSSSSSSARGRTKQPRNDTLPVEPKPKIDTNSVPYDAIMLRQTEPTPVVRQLEPNTVVLNQTEPPGPSVVIRTESSLAVQIQEAPQTVVATNRTFSLEEIMFLIGFLCLCLRALVD